MSQILYRYQNKDGEWRIVQTGWDRPLNYCHFTVYGAGNDEVYYSEPDIPSSFHARPMDIIKGLARLGIPFPSYLPTLLQEHMDGNVGNVIVHLSLDEPSKVEEFDKPEFPTYVGSDGQEHGEY